MDMSILGHIVHDVANIIFCVLTTTIGICIGMQIQEYRDLKRRKRNEHDRD